MKRKIFTLALSFLTAFTAFFGVSNHQVAASELESVDVNEMKQNSKYVTVPVELEYVPPAHYFYSSGGYAGYLSLVNYFFNGSKYQATYTGYLYDSPPYPSPTLLSIDEE